MSAGRACLIDHPHSYRTALKWDDGKITYRGPYGTVGAARGQATSWKNSYGGRIVDAWVEWTPPGWERVED